MSGWLAAYGSTANGWRRSRSSTIHEVEYLKTEPKVAHINPLHLSRPSTSGKEVAWQLMILTCEVSLPAFGSILEWKPVRLFRVKRDIGCVEIVAPIAVFEVMNIWFEVSASSSLCCWPAWAHHFRSTLWFRLLKNAGKFKCVNPNMSTWKFGCDHHLWKKQSINKIWFSKIEFL